MTMARNGFMTSLGGFLGDIGRAQKANTLYSNLSLLSDDALAARGLKRDDLPSYAFKRAFGEN